MTTKISSILIATLLIAPILASNKCIDGTTYDHAKKSCIPLPKDLCTGISGPMLFPHAECNKYYMCLDEHTLVLTCDKGYEFDPIFRQCVRISDHGCTAMQATSTTADFLV